MLLDLVEVARSHSGVNLAQAFANVLKEFGIEDKVSSNITQLDHNWDLPYHPRFSVLPATTHPTTTL